MKKTQIFSIWFDGDGKRVKKYVPSTGETTIFHYDAGGKLIAEYSTIVETSNPQVSYLTNDHLGSPRITTDKDGDVYSRRDFLPFGEELNASHTSQRSVYGGDSVRQKFTGYERDDEIELDFAESRMNSYIVGRFNSPDPYNIVLESMAKLDNSEAQDVLRDYLMYTQQWNRYSYAINNPLVYVDPSGEVIVIKGKTKEEKQKSLDALKDLLGDDAGANLDYDVNDDGSWNVKYSGTLSADAGKIGIVLEDLIDNKKKVVDFAVTNDKYYGDGGGKTTIDGDNITVRISSSAVATANWKLNGTNGSDGKQLMFTQSTIVAHELGHAWGAIKDRTFERSVEARKSVNSAGEFDSARERRRLGSSEMSIKRSRLRNENNGRAVQVENWQRQRLGMARRRKH